MDNYDLNALKISLEELDKNIIDLLNEISENRLILKHEYRDINKEYIQDRFRSAEVALRFLSEELSTIFDITIPEKIKEKSTEEDKNGRL